MGLFNFTLPGTKYQQSGQSVFYGKLLTGHGKKIVTKKGPGTFSSSRPKSNDGKPTVL